MRSWKLAIIGMAALLVLLACGESANVGTTVAGGGKTSASTAVPKASAFKLGDIVKVGDWQVTLNSVKSSAGGDFDTPKSGNVYLIVDATFQNISAKAQTLSTLLQVNLKDSTGQKYDTTIASSVVTSSPDGDVNAGDMVRGQIVWEVPTAMKQFVFAFKSDVFSSGYSIWNIVRS